MCLWMKSLLLSPLNYTVDPSCASCVLFINRQIKKKAPAFSVMYISMPLSCLSSAWLDNKTTVFCVCVEGRSEAEE